jgi:hypothetical protein
MFWRARGPHTAERQNMVASGSLLRGPPQPRQDQSPPRGSTHRNVRPALTLPEWDRMPAEVPSRKDHYLFCSSSLQYCGTGARHPTVSQRTSPFLVCVNEVVQHRSYWLGREAALPRCPGPCGRTDFPIRPDPDSEHELPTVVRCPSLRVPPSLVT